VLGTTYCAEDSSPIGQTLIAFRRAGDAAIRDRFWQARADGDLPAHADPEELTDFIRTVVYGMAVQAASGATRKDLERVIQRTMRGWPQ
jgi:DNA-binding NarL/FixJ family response regulator